MKFHFDRSNCVMCADLALCSVLPPHVFDYPKDVLCDDCRRLRVAIRRRVSFRELVASSRLQ